MVEKYGKSAVFGGPNAKTRPIHRASSHLVKATDAEQCFISIRCEGEATSGHHEEEHRKGPDSKLHLVIGPQTCLVTAKAFLELSMFDHTLLRLCSFICSVASDHVSQSTMDFKFRLTHGTHVLPFQNWQLPLCTLSFCQVGPQPPFFPNPNRPRSHSPYIAAAVLILPNPKRRCHV